MASASDAEVADVTRTRAADRDRVILLCIRLNFEEQTRLRRAAAATAGGGRRDGVAERSLGVRGAAVALEGKSKAQPKTSARLPSCVFEK